MLRGSFWAAVASGSEGLVPPGLAARPVPAPRNPREAVAAAPKSLAGEVEPTAPIVASASAHPTSASVPPLRPWPPPGPSPGQPLAVMLEVVTEQADTVATAASMSMCATLGVGREDGGTTTAPPDDGRVTSLSSSATATSFLVAAQGRVAAAAQLAQPTAANEHGIAAPDSHGTDYNDGTVAIFVNEHLLNADFKQSQLW